MYFKIKLILCLFILRCFNSQIQAAQLARDKTETSQAVRDRELSRHLDTWITAAEVGNLETIESLIDQIDVNAHSDSGLGETALGYAACFGHEKIVERLLKVPGIDVNNQNKLEKYSPLIWAAWHGRENIVKLLLQVKGIDINACTTNGMTALMAANINGYSARNQNVVKMLMEHPGINLNAKDSKGEPALMIAAYYGVENMVKLFLQTPEIQINIKNAKLFGDIKERNPHIAQLIEDRIGQLNKQAFESIAHNNLDRLRSIIFRIGDDIVDQWGNTLLDKAFAANHPAIILFLLNNSSDPRELLARFPFEGVQPSSEIFKFCVELAYNKEPITTAPKDSTDSTLDKSAEMAAQDTSKSLKSCGFCAKQACDKLCGKCKKIYYCSVACQKSHWAEHKLNCGSIDDKIKNPLLKQA